MPEIMERIVGCEINEAAVLATRKVNENASLRLLKRGKMTIKEISEDTGLALDEVKVPDAMTSYVETYDEKQGLYRNALILYRPIHNLQISYGRAAELLDINKYDLINIYADMEIPYYDISKDKLDAELETYKKLKGNT